MKKPARTKPKAPATRLACYYVRVSRQRPGQFCVVRASDQAEVFHTPSVDSAFRARKALADESGPAPAPPRPD